jgi:hypothetical protein
MYQFCQEYPPTYNTGTCHTFHRDGLREYDGYDYLVPPDTSSSNYLKCYFKFHDYRVEKEHEKVCKFSIIRRNTLEVLDSMYLIIRRGDLPCNINQPDTGGATGINTLSADDVAQIYPNPASNFFTITAIQDQLTACSLYAPDGRMILDKNIENKKSFTIDAGDLSNGIYYLKFTDRKRKSFYKKIVVDH